MSPLEDSKNAPDSPATEVLQTQEQTSVIKFSKEPANKDLILPSLFGAGYGTYQVRPENFILSFLTHTLGIALLLWLVHFTVQTKPPETKYSMTPLMVDPYQPPMNRVGAKPGGGGGGGDASKIRASAGAPPKANLDQQLAPVTVDIPKQQAKITVQPTVVADLKFPQNVQVGDPLSKLMVPSNGTGIGSGIGSGSGGGVGAGDGRGLGKGTGANYGGGAFHVGNGVTKPEAIFSPDPDYSEEARKAKYQGTVVLTVIVGADGRVHNATVARSLGMGLDEKALERVMTWKFRPATKDSRPVPVEVNIEVTFNLY